MLSKPLKYDPGRGMGPGERKVRRRLQQAMLAFVDFVMPVGRDDLMRESCLETYRAEVERAAEQGVEVALCWHTLGTWSNDGPDRIACFTRALACVESGSDRFLATPGPRHEWSEAHLRADCLFEIGRIHFHEGDPELARDFLERALPLARESDALRSPAGITHEDQLEGKIAELLLQLPI